MLDTYFHLFCHEHKKDGDEYLLCDVFLQIYHVLIKLPKVTKNVTYAVSGEQSSVHAPKMQGFIL